MRTRSKRPTSSGPSAPADSPAPAVATEPKKPARPAKPREAERPPARVEPRPVRPYGSLRLRRLLKLSDAVDLETLCQEAADEIDQLRSELASNRFRDPFDER